MSTLRVDNLNARTGTTITVPTGTKLYAPGSIVQVVNTYHPTASSQSVTGSWTTQNDISSLYASITPTSTSSKIYITVRWFGEFGSSDQAYNCIFGLKRNGSAIGLSGGGTIYGIHMAALSYTYTDVDSTPETCFFDYYDSPASTASLTYQVYVSLSSSQTLYTNRVVNSTYGPGGAASYERGTSSITLFEIAG